MSPEKNLDTLLATLDPILNPGTFVFCSFANGILPDGLGAVATFVEEDGISAIVRLETAEELHIPSDGTFEWITLKVFSDLEAVGLTAAVSTELTKAGISANVVAAYSHDHVFVPKGRGEEACEILKDLADSSQRYRG